MRALISKKFVGFGSWLIITACASSAPISPSQITPIPDTQKAIDWQLPPPYQNICRPEKLPVVWGNGFDGKIEDALNIQDELSKLPWKNVYLFLSPRSHQWGTSELCIVLATLGQYQSELLLGATVDSAKTPFIGIGDISFKGGKRFHRHISHQTGFDADIFYIRKFAGAGDIPTNFPLAHRWKRTSNRFPEKLVLDKEQISENFDVLTNFKAFAYLQKKFGVWITTDRLLIEKIKGLGDAIDPAELSLFLENAQHVEGHEDHFHLGLDCQPTQPHCKSQWSEWRKFRKAGKPWKFQYN